MTSWFDSSSLSGFLSQAQKSIDKVLDIPIGAGGGENEKKHIGTVVVDTKTASQDNQEKNGDDKVQVSNSSWLSGEDSFWGSFTTQTKVDEKTHCEPEATKQLKKIEPKKIKPRKNEIKKTINESELSEKRSRPENVRRNNGKRNLKKKKASDSVKKEGDKIQCNEPGNMKETINDSNTKDTGNLVTNRELLSLGEESKVNNDCVKTIAVNSVVVETESIENCLDIPHDDITDGLNTEKHKISPELIDSGGLPVASLIDEEENRITESSPVLSEVLLTEESTQVNDKVIPGNEKEVVDASDFNQIEKLQSKESDLESEIFNLEEVDSFCSTPVASSTPSISRTKGTLTSVSDLKEDNSIVSSHEDLLKMIETSDNQSFNLDVGTEFVEKDARSEEENSNEVMGINEMQNINGDSLKKENKRLVQVVEIRESKLVKLSKENLDLQETNAILRSQLQQLEEVHKTEDEEFEEMKQEFTNRISNAESKFQDAAKERDLYKKQLEETQQCLSSDIERQLKDFQLLSQQKDQQIVELMEEGEKLSKEVLQRSNNIKKLRSKEKETSEENETQKTRLKEAESEVERLTGILKERDEHKKEQDDAIKKLNSYTQKQDEQLAKQKVELEESSAKLPSLQTALDNAYKEITELHKVNAAKSNAVQEATLSVEMTAKEQLRIAMEKLKKESQKDCDVLALEVTDLQIQLSRSEQQAARREDNLRQEIADVHTRLQEAESRNQELTQSVSVATRPLLRQIENLQHSFGSQQTSWEKVEKNLTERLAEAQSQQATSQEKERSATEKSMDLSSRVTSLELQVGNYRHEKSRFEAELEIEKTKSEALEEFKSRETGKIEALKTMHSKQLETMLVEKSLLEQQLVVERSKFDSEQKKISRLEDKLSENMQKVDNLPSRNDYVGKEIEDNVFMQNSNGKSRSRNTSTSSQMSLSDTINRGLASGGTAILEELHATIRHKEGELSSMESAISTLEVGRESLAKELTTLMSTNENLLKENINLARLGQSFQELQTKYNALLQMYGEKQEETEELKLDLQDVKMMFKAQIQELLSGR